MRGVVYGAVLARQLVGRASETAAQDAVGLAGGDPRFGPPQLREVSSNTYRSQRPYHVVCVY